MPHFFVDDGFSDSKEVLAISGRHRLAAVGLWTLCGSWSANKLTDGWIPNEVLKRLGARPVIVSALVDQAGLWERGKDGVRFASWSKWQRTREQVKSYREFNAEKKRRQREKAKSTATSADSEMSPGDCPEDRELCPPGTALTPIPIPIPIKERTPNGVPKKTPAQHGSRLPDGWKPPDSVVAQMRSDHPHVDLQLEHAKFTDHWNDQPGARGRKVDWVGTWRNWIRRAAEQTPHRNGRHLSTADQRVAQIQAMKTQPQRLEIE